MIRILGLACIAAPLTMPAAAADLPIVINLPSDLPKIINAKPSDQKLPEVINRRAGGDAGSATQGMGAYQGAARGPVVHPLVPEINAVVSLGMAVPYCAPGCFVAPFVDAGCYWGAYYGSGFYPAVPLSSGYFYTFAPPAVLYRDILSRPLGKTVYLPPGGLAVFNPSGCVANISPVYSR